MLGLAKACTDLRHEAASLSMLIWMNLTPRSAPWSPDRWRMSSRGMSKAAVFDANRLTLHAPGAAASSWC